MKAKEFTKALENAKVIATIANEKFEQANNVWRADYNNKESWEVRKKAERAMNEANREVTRLTILTGSKIYANQYFYSDIEPWEVIEIKTDRCLVVREMKTTIKPEAKKALADSFQPGGFCGHFDNYEQAWNFESDENGRIAEIRLHKDGCYHLAGEKGTRFRIAVEPKKFYDYNF